MRKQRPILVAAVSVLLCLLSLGFAAKPSTQPPAPAAQTAAPKPAIPPPQAPVPHARPFVILDPAHGGSESGAAISPALLEKNINLALARRLQKELEARGIPVVLTRTGDNLLTADQRAISANTSHASLYIVLHAAMGGHGVRFYTAMLAPAQAGERRKFLLWQQAQSPHLTQSSAAAAALSAACASGGLPVRESTALVRPLNSVTLPAVAVELSPLGGSPDELADADYQQKIAASLASGIAQLKGEWEAAR